MQQFLRVCHYNIARPRVQYAQLAVAICFKHMAWVLLVWWNFTGLARWIRAIALVFVVLTATATLGTGEHYVIDMVVAFPFSLMLRWCRLCALTRCLSAAGPGGMLSCSERCHPDLVGPAELH